MDDDRILNEQEAAQFLKVTVHALRAWRWRKKDEPSYAKLGSCVRYRLSDLEAHLESRLVKGTPDREAQPRRRSGVPRQRRSRGRAG
jgi:hypothetical protein